MQCKTLLVFHRLNFFCRLNFIVIILKRYSVQNRLIVATISKFFCTDITVFCESNSKLVLVFRLTQQSAVIEIDCKLILSFEKAQMEESQKVVISIIIPNG